MPNVESIIQGNNKKKLCKDTPDLVNAPKCNCRDKTNCPLKGDCQQTNVIYQAKVISDNKVESYVGLASDFKQRHYNHKASFNDYNKRYATELSKYIWKLKDNNKLFQIKWSILCKSKPYSNVTKRCDLCISEKYYIICEPSLATLNKRNELLSKCRHTSKFIIGNVT